MVTDNKPGLFKYRAFIAIERARDNVEQGGLARAVDAEKSYAVALTYCHIYVF
jgi:hypothetical protein